jgi:hypothetical protein
VLCPAPRRRDADDTPPTVVGNPRLPGTTPADLPSRLGDPARRARILAQVSPFSTWPSAARSRRAVVARVVEHRPGKFLVRSSKACDTITEVAAGTVFSCVSRPHGRHPTYKFDDSYFAHGLASLVDGLALQIDLIADGPAAAIGMPHAAVRAELTRAPSLWESVSVEIIRRSRRDARAGRPWARRQLTRNC